MTTITCNTINVLEVLRISTNQNPSSRLLSNHRLGNQVIVTQAAVFELIDYQIGEGTQHQDDHAEEPEPQRPTKNRLMQKPQDMTTTLPRDVANSDTSAIHSNDNPVKRKALSPWTKSVVAGSVAGMASVVVCHPFDTIRTRLQISPTRFRGFFHCASLTVRNESVWGLYKGFLPPFFSQAVYKSVIFTTSSHLRTDIFPNSTLLQPYLTPSIISLSSGAIAGGLNAFLVTPVELIRNRLQVQYESQRDSRKYRGTYHCITQVVKHEGVLALWKGLSTTILRDSLGVACYFLGYDFARQRLAAYDSFNETAVLLSAGAIGGISFWAIALPFDTVKSLIQVNGQRGTYTGLITSTSHLVSKYGVAHLFRGWQAAFSRGIPGAAITFWAFERANKYLEQLETANK